MDLTKILVEHLTKEEKEIVSKILKTIPLTDLKQIIDTISYYRCHEMGDRIYDIYFEGHDSFHNDDMSDFIPILKL